LESVPFNLPKEKQHLCLDAGYQGEEIKELCDKFLYTMHLRSRGEEKKQLEKGILKKARRWVVERTASWLNRFRALLIRWNKKAENYLALIYFACGIIVWKSALCG